MTVKRILAQRLDESTIPSLPLPTAAATTFARTPDELVEHVYAGGTSWR